MNLTNAIYWAFAVLFVIIATTIGVFVLMFLGDCFLDELVVYYSAFGLFGFLTVPCLLYPVWKRKGIMKWMSPTFLKVFLPFVLPGFLSAFIAMMIEFA